VKQRADRVAVLLLCAIWALVVALVGVGGDYALNDDWAYAYTARHLLHTGQIRLLDWGAPSLVTHALWGAGALALLGDTHVALRCGTLVFALAALLALYGVARRVLDPWTAAIGTLFIGLSPWFVNLSFTYMTDIPWLAMMLGAILALTRALHPSSLAPPRPWLVLLSGLLVGIAALTRQFAVVTTPAFLLVLALDARRRHGGRWLGPAARSSLLFAAPVAALFVPFQIWYTHVHGPTQANRETVTRILEIRPWHVLIHVISILHYAGLCLFPLALALLRERRLGEVVSRRQAEWALVLLGVFAVGRPLVGPYVHPRGPGYADGPGDNFHPWMPYLGNVFYRVGLGPPTLTDVYAQHAPWPHASIALGVVLTVTSTLGGVAGAGLLVTTVRRAREAFREARPVEDGGRGLWRVLLVSFTGAYLIFQLCTATLIFDRYLLPIFPVIVLLGLDAAPPHLARAPVVVACLAAVALFSVAGTREYLSWNDARDRAVRALVAAGVPPAEIDGGFEYNGPLHFEAFRRRTGKLIGDDGYFWLVNARYRLSFWPSRGPECTTRDHQPYWTWPGGGDRAVYVLECDPPASDRSTMGAPPAPRTPPAPPPSPREARGDRAPGN
jgi:4-amino-4-deoxy-L-arabinose transferase-like glycosyltransferase